MNTNLKAFLDMIAYSEGTSKLGKNNGYDVIVSSRANNIIRIDDLSRHPRVTVQMNGSLWSSAAGRYQIIWPTWKSLSIRLGLQDFSPESQDKAAIELIRECGALEMVNKGEISDAIRLCSKVWASLPGAGYGQHENSMEALLTNYQMNGGHIS